MILETKNKIRKKLLLKYYSEEKIDIFNLLDKNNRRNLKNKEKRDNKICKICGKLNKEHTLIDNEVCKHQFNWFYNLINLGLNINKLGTKDIFNEYFKVKDLLYKEYVKNELSSCEIEKKYNLKRKGLTILEAFNIKIRTLSEAQKINILHKGTNIINNNYLYKHGYHLTWDNKKVYYRSSYELEYAKYLDNNKIPYNMEHIRLKYFDSIENKIKIAIVDFNIINTNILVEIKSLYTFNKQNMIDKFISYINNGYFPILKLENNFYTLDNLKNL